MGPFSADLNRRRFLASGSLAITSLAGRPASAASSVYPKGFLWGAATAAHQVEGNNINSDLWVLENIRPTMYAERSGDACDHYHRYRDDIRLLAGLGFNTYRFSIEWARIEPERGFFSNAELEHYRRVLACCHENNLTPMVTFYHFTMPRWLAAMGGWQNPEAVDLFARYCERSAKHMGDLIAIASTLNEPNIPLLMPWIPMFKPSVSAEEVAQAAARAVGSDRFGTMLFGSGGDITDHLVAAHHRGLAAMKSGPGKYPVGVNVAISDDQAVGADSKRDERRRNVYGPWMAAAAKSDYIGVQTYTRSRVGRDGDLPPEAGVELTDMGYEFWPEALEQTIRYAHEQAKVPVYVTENGIGTENDERRVEYIRRALAGVQNCLRDGIDVRGYVHWSLLDNFEWIFGYRPKFGLVAVNRETQERTVKQSARYLGEIARHS
jgi:beta-glucosidase